VKLIFRNQELLYSHIVLHFVTTFISDEHFTNFRGLSHSLLSVAWFWFVDYVLQLHSL